MERREPTAAGSRIADVAVLAVALALVTATGHLLVVGAERHLLGQFIWMSRDLAWMTPAAYLAIFLTASVPLALATLLAPRLVGVRAVAFVLGTLAAVSLLLFVPRVHPLATLVLALGVGVQTARVVDGLGARWRRVARVGAGALAVALAITAGAAAAADALRERRAIASLPPASPDAPNVLLIILDTVRGANMHFLGYGRATTPLVDRLAAEGAVFEHAFSTAPWTLTAHASLFTGVLPGALSASWLRPLDAAHRTLAEELRARGYRTAGFVANHYYTGHETGLSRGFERYEDYLVSARQMLLSTTLTQTELFSHVLHAPTMGGRLRALARFELRTLPINTSDRKRGETVAADFLRWQGRLPRGRPWFAFLNLYDAHIPYDPPAPWGTRFAAAPTPLDRYDGAIAYMDDVLGHTLDGLRRRGSLDNTVVVISSDHGESFGEHGLEEHANSLYLTELHVPLVIRFPARVPAGTRVSEPVSLRDLPATLLDLVGATSHPIPGASLATTWTHGVRRPSAVVAQVEKGINTPAKAPVSRGDMQSVLDRELHYIRNGDGVEELYAWPADPLETTDLARTEQGRQLLPGRRSALAAALGGAGVAAPPVAARAGR